MQRNIDAQTQRRKDAVRSTVVATMMLAASAAGMLLLRWLSQAQGLAGAVLLILSMLDLGMVIPVWILLKKRLKEIEGGEEDAAAQY